MRIYQNEIDDNESEELKENEIFDLASPNNK